MFDVKKMQTDIAAEQLSDVESVDIQKKSAAITISKCYKNKQSRGLL